MCSCAFTVRTSIVDRLDKTALVVFLVATLLLLLLLLLLPLLHLCVPEESTKNAMRFGGEFTTEYDNQP